MNKSYHLNYSKIIDQWQPQKFFWMSIIFLLATHFSAKAQTLISPTGVGGFESGATFALNGWTEVNDGNNKWYVGPFVKSA